MQAFFSSPLMLYIVGPFLVLIGIGFMAHASIKNRLYASVVSAVLFALLYIAWLWWNLGDVINRFGQVDQTAVGFLVAVTFLAALPVSLGVGLVANRKSHRPPTHADTMIRSGSEIFLVCAAYALTIIGWWMAVTASSWANSFAGRAPGNASLDVMFFVPFCLLVALILVGAVGASLVAILSSKNNILAIFALPPIIGTVFVGLKLLGSLVSS